ncbi:MAG: peptide deformylase [Oscillospiraceae bacterium]|nr:peptide deformylase [Oscillospiraceae bacterium]
MVKEIVKDPVFLSQKAEKANKNDMQTVTDLCDTLTANADRCVGLAANMIGVNKTVLAAFIGDKLTVMINPDMVNKSKKTYEAEEGCLSLTGKRTVTRFEVIEVEYLDKRFKRKKQVFKGFDAEIIQHEMDHFEGKLI